MHLNLTIEPSQNQMFGKLWLNRSEIETLSFMLNRDFTIHKIVMDHADQSDKIPKEEICLHDCFDYRLNQFTLMQEFESLEIHFSGTLTGETGSCPYVKEQISEAFTLIRFETYCYPLFIPQGERGVNRYLRGSDNQDHIAVDVPRDYVLVSGEVLVGVEQIGEGLEERKLYSYKGNSRDFSAALARYKTLETSGGRYFILGKEIDLNFVENTLRDANLFMQENFGTREIHSDAQYCVIPSGFGSFAVNKTVFIQEDTLSNKEDIAGMIHEFIHLGWNAKVELFDQRSRFFDEGFTNYFVLRVVEDLWGEAQRNAEIKRYERSFNRYLEKMDGIPSVTEFSKLECGGLSYSIGALILWELETLLGRYLFDALTRQFLSDYQHKETTFVDFCRAYNPQNSEEIEDFYRNWIYSAKGYEKYLK